MKLKDYLRSYEKAIDKDFDPECSSDYTRAEKILKLIPEKGQLILDIGCNDGELSKQFKKQGNTVIGIEINPYLAEKAKEKLDKVIIQDAEDSWQVLDNYFDIVVLSAVLEHVFDTDFLLEESYRVLKSDGHLIVAVPNIAVFGNRIKLLFGKPIDWIDTYGEHIRAFTKPSLEALLKKHKFKPIYWTGNERKIPKTNIRLPYFEKLFPNLCRVIICYCEKMTT